MSLARKTRIWLAHDGKCGCGVAVPVTGPNVIYDHAIQLWLGGGDADGDVQPLCLDCDRAKTANDARIRAKVKRLWKLALFRQREPSRIPSRPFSTIRRPFPKGRGFPKRSR